MVLPIRVSDKNNFSSAVDRNESILKLIYCAYGRVGVSGWTVWMHDWSSANGNSTPRDRRPRHILGITSLYVHFADGPANKILRQAFCLSFTVRLHMTFHNYRSNGSTYNENLTLNKHFYATPWDNFSIFNALMAVIEFQSVNKFQQVP